MNLAGQKPRVEDVAARVERRLSMGDHILLTSSAGSTGVMADFTARCGPEGVLSQLDPGVEVSIDDGKVSSVVESCDVDWAMLRVTRVPPKGKLFRPGLGLNFPGRHMKLPALTPSDTTTSTSSLRTLTSSAIRSCRAVRT